MRLMNKEYVFLCLPLCAICGTILPLHVFTKDNNNSASWRTGCEFTYGTELAWNQSLPTKSVAGGAIPAYEPARLKLSKWTRALQKSYMTAASVAEIA
jgi:hypothetical protein